MTKATQRDAEVLLYQVEDDRTRVEVRFEGETAWLSLGQIADLFQRDKSVISRHIRNVFEEGELRREAVVAQSATTAVDGKTYATRSAGPRLAAPLNGCSGPAAVHEHSVEWAGGIDGIYIASLDLGRHGWAYVGVAFAVATIVLGKGATMIAGSEGLIFCDAGDGRDALDVGRFPVAKPARADIG